MLIALGAIVLAIIATVRVARLERELGVLRRRLDAAELRPARQATPSQSNRRGTMRFRWLRNRPLSRDRPPRPRRLADPVGTTSPPPAESPGVSPPFIPDRPAPRRRRHRAHTASQVRRDRRLSCRQSCRPCLRQHKPFSKGHSSGASASVSCSMPAWCWWCSRWDSSCATPSSTTGRLRRFASRSALPVAWHSSPAATVSLGPDTNSTDSSLLAAASRCCSCRCTPRSPFMR